MLKPWLEAKINNSWVDPRAAESDEDLLYRYKVAWAFAQAAQQIIDYAEGLTEESEALTDKEEGKTTNKLREGLS